MGDSLVPMSMPLYGGRGHGATRLRVGKRPTLPTLSGRGGFTPCHLAAHWDRASCLEALLEAGADATRRAKGGLTAAHVAAAFGALNTLRYLHRQGADMEKINEVSHVVSR